jgi:hypothetical protein
MYDRECASLRSGKSIVDSFQREGVRDGEVDEKRKRVENPVFIEAPRFIRW